MTIIPIKQGETRSFKPKASRSGRPWATVEHTCRGTILQCDDGFTCLQPNDIRRVYQDRDGLYIWCSEGKHHLADQQELAEDGTEFYIGLWNWMDGASQ